jgi:hypothetical protein
MATLWATIETTIAQDHLLKVIVNPTRWYHHLACKFYVFFGFIQSLWLQAKQFNFFLCNVVILDY